MLVGFLILFICIYLLLNILGRILNWKTWNLVFKKWHRPCGFLVLIVLTLHILITMDVWSNRSILLIGTGILAAIFLILMAVGYLLRKKIGRKWILLHRAGAFAIIVFIVSHMTFYYIDLYSYKTKISEIQITGIDTSQVKDGTYEGHYDAGYIYAKVSVKVKDGKMENITLLEHRNERGKAAEILVDKIKAQQNTKVDAVSGATNSSLVIEKAVENALSHAKY